MHWAVTVAGHLHRTTYLKLGLQIAHRHDLKVHLGHRIQVDGQPCPENDGLLILASWRLGCTGLFTVAGPLRQVTCASWACNYLDMNRESTLGALYSRFMSEQPPKTMDLTLASLALPLGALGCYREQSVV
jgi:hypothetical protein